MFQNIFSKEDIEYINQLPEVINAKNKLDVNSSKGVIYFKISLTESIRNTLFTRFGVDFSNVTEIPMRWIKGDIGPHVDTGPTEFENTYLVYLNDSPGEFVLESTSYPITANTGFVFNEGLSHKTQNTGIIPRLLVGPMNEFATSVGLGDTIIYYNNYIDALAQNLNYIAIQDNSWILGELVDISGDIGSYTSWRIAYVYGTDPPPSGFYSNGFALQSVAGNYTYYVYPATPCFLEGTKILCYINNDDSYIPIENIKSGTLVKTNQHGYQKVKLIGKSTIQNPGNDDRIEDRLYKCSVTNYPELNEDLFITGYHSILVDTLTDIQRKEIIKHVGKIFVTENKYRLIACADERAEPWNSKNSYNIWHIALENPDEKMNYGIYANGGLLVESCAILFLKNKSNMIIV